MSIPAGHFANRGKPLANAQINVHVHSDGLIGDNREQLGLSADMLAQTVLHIENIRARRQGNTIFSLRVRRKPRNFFFLSGVKTTRGYSAKVSAVTAGTSSSASFTVLGE